MDTEAENPKGTEMEQDISSGDPAKGLSKGGILLAGAILLVVGAAVFVLVRTDSSRPLTMPRASFTHKEIDAAMADLEKRAVDVVVLTGQEKEIVAVLEELHGLEVASAPPDAGTGGRVRELMEIFRSKARALHDANPERFLELGSRLALDFQGALTDLLEIAGEHGLLRTLEAGGEPVEQVVRTGGAFVKKAVEVGLIDDRGVLHAPKLLPPVLFLRRWFGMAGLGSQAKFSKTEQRANHDFVIAFSTPGHLRGKLRAIDKLVQLESGYDGDLAKILAFRQAGRGDEARALVEEAVKERGRNDLEIMLDPKFRDSTLLER